MRAQTIGFLVSILLVVPCALAQTERAVPFELYQRHLIVTRGAIGVLEGRRLLIDTGSIPSVVDAGIARRLKLQTTPSVLIAFGRQVAVKGAVLDGFRVGSFRSGPVPASVGDLSYLNGVGVDAIVGLDVLARTSFSIDYEKHELHFAPSRSEDWISPLEVEWPFVTVRMVLGDDELRLLVDTGSADLVIFKSRLPRSLADLPWRGDKVMRYASGAGRLQRLELRRVRVGDHVWEELEGWLLDRSLEGYPPRIDGVLGVRALGCARVRFDFDRNQFGCSAKATPR